MLKIISRRFYLFLYFVFSALVLETVTFHILGLGVFPKYFFYNLSIILCIAFVIFAIPNFTVQFVMYTIVLGLQAAFIYLNYSLLTIYGDLFSIEMPAYIGEAAEAMTSNFVYFTVILQLLGLFTIDFIFGFFLLKFCKKERVKVANHISLVMAILLIGLELLSCGYIMLKRSNIESSASIGEANYVESDSFLIKTSILKTPSYKAFGTYGYVMNMLISKLAKANDEVQNRAINFFKSGKIYGTDDNISILVDDDNNNLAQITGIDAGNNVIMIMMESAEWFAFSDGNYDTSLDNMSKELTPNIYYLLYGQDEDVNNDYLGDNGIMFSNHFAKSKTNFSEAIGLLGQYPMGSVLSDLTKNAETVPSNLYYSLPYMLKNSEYNYYTSYVHSNVLSFYQRDKTHKYLGFDDVVGKDGILDENGKQKYTGNELKWDHWTEEVEIVKDTMEYLVPNEETLNGKPFFSFYLNVSSHGEYKNISTKEDCVKYREFVMYGEDNCELVDNVYKLKNGLSPENSYSIWYSNILNNYQRNDLDLIERLICYEASMVGLDKAIGTIVDELKTRTYQSGGKMGQTYFDNTTLILYSDHYAYYGGLSNRFKGIDEHDYSSVELQTIPMIISSPGMRKLNKSLIELGKEEYCLTKKIGFTTHADIVPTVLDLLGIKFNENAYLGSSVFAPATLSSVYLKDGKYYEMRVFCSNTGGIFSEDIYTYDMKNFVYDPNVVTAETMETFKEQAKILLTKINYMDIINRYKLYNRCVE